MKHRGILIVVVLLSLMAGCTAQPIIAPSPTATLPAPTAPLTSAPSATLTLTPTPRKTSTPRPPTPTASPTPTLAFVTPEVIQVCPEQREVGWAELGINPNYALLAAHSSEWAASYREWVGNFRNPITTDILVIPVGNPTPQPVPNVLTKDGWILQTFALSPSGQWLRLDYYREEDLQVATWVSSLDGQTQWEVTVQQIDHDVIWVTDDEMLVLGVPGHENDPPYTWWSNNYFPLYSINPFTGETWKIPLPTLRNSAVYRFYFRLEDHAYLVYDNKTSYDRKTYMYDLTEGKNTRIFQWLIGADWYDRGTNRRDYNQRRNGLFYTFIRRSYGFDIALDLDFETISQPLSYNNIMRAVVLPWGYESDQSTSLDPWATSAAFSVTRNRTGGFYSPTPFYMLDYANMKLYDYCLDRLLYFISPDEKFAAINMERFDPLSSNTTTVVAVLNLETGYLAYLPGSDGLMTLGWVITGDSGGSQ